MATVRCIVRDVDVSVNFYRTHFGFELIQQFGPAMAIIRSGDLELWLAGPVSSAAKTVSSNAPSGWTRVVLQTADLSKLVSFLRDSGVRFNTEVISGPGGKQAICEDPSGNHIELFEPRT